MTATAAALSATPSAGVASPTSPLTVTLEATASRPGPGATITDFAFDCGAYGPAPVPVPGQLGKATCTYVRAPGRQLRTQLRT